LSDKGAECWAESPVDGWGMHFDDPRMDPFTKNARWDAVNIHVGETCGLRSLDEHTTA
jgi:hypothetical protein